MLTELRIRNYAIIESVNVPFTDSLNVLSGETGAGKSIIVGALGLLIGGRASVEHVRSGADRATIEGVFDVRGDADLERWLDDHGIEVADGLVVIKREVAAASSRARAWINGSPVTTALLTEIGHQLVNVHGQHEAQALLDPDAQRSILDQFGESAEAGNAVSLAWAARNAARAARDELVARREDARKRADYLAHVAREVDDAQLKEGEDAALADEAHRLAHATELRSIADGLQQQLEDGDEGAVRRLGQLQRGLSSLVRIDPGASSLQDVYDAAYYALVELARASGAYRDGIDTDPERLDAVERRRELIARIIRKHGTSVADAIEAGRAAREQLQLLDSAERDTRACDERLAAAEEALQDASRILTARRIAAAAALDRAVTEQLGELGMAGGRFSASLVPRSVSGEFGAEDVAFEVALNVGYEARPLARVASGGELSRVMLAIKTILARVDRVPTLVFDEVDSGIGGAVGVMVGDKLRRVAAHHQVFVITHLAQIAARASHHVAVRKGARSGVTTADVVVVDGDARVSELARMLGGDAERVESLAHARELLRSASNGDVARTPASRQVRQRPKSRR